MYENHDVWRAKVPIPKSYNLAHIAENGPAALEDVERLTVEDY